jgi:succinate dehydrogenase/fumarate reductase flavoprotein subunit
MMHDEHQAHRGPMRIKLDHMPEDKIREVEDILFSTERPVQERFYQGRGVDFRTGEIELWPTEAFLCGGHGQTGVRVNTKAESTVPGLYAAGDTSLVARGHLTGAFVYGEIAAEHATEYAAARGATELDPSQVDDFIEDKKKRCTSRNGKIPIEEFEYKVRRMINDYIVPPKNDYKLGRAIWWMDRFRKELFEMVNVGDVHDLFKTYEVENIIQCALMSALASRERTESRWGLWHYRSDYPAKDEKWRKHIILKMGESPEDVLVSHAPVLTLQGT